MREVYVSGIGCTKVKEMWETPLRSLAVEAIRKAMQDAQIDSAEALYVGNMLSGELCSQEHLGALVSDFAALDGIEAFKVE
ncbi:MAG: thiolase domain-containing protein, partial [Candidatus Methanofastidiosia archaeon]